ncbi:MAG: FAD-dependent oxidoreductase, partial [Planctomycetota bacterium]
MISGPIRTKTPPRVVIVGAGPGGLAAAMLLRHAGCEVTVLERRESVGGRTSSIRAEGFRFDLGPTFFLYPRVVAEVFRTVGRDLYAEVPMARLDPQYRIEFGAGGRIDATADETRMDEQIARLSPGDVGNFRRYMQENRE